MFTLDQLVAILLHYKYLILFPITALEGPIITIIAGFLSSLGLMNVYLAYGVVVLGDLFGDGLYYAIGRYGRKFVERWGKFIGATEERVEKLESHFREKSGRTLMTGKFLHGVGGAILVAAGTAKMPFWEFIFYNILGTIPKSLLLILIGYYFGSYLTRINSILDVLALFFLGLGAIVLLYFIYGRKKID